MDEDDSVVRGALRFAVYKRLAGSLALYLGFLTLVHLFWSAACAILEPPGGVAVAFLGRSQTILTALELSVAGLCIAARWRSTFCASAAGFVLPLLLALALFGVRLSVARGGSWYDERAYGNASDWSNAKAAHISAAFRRAYFGHVMWSGFRDWLFLIGAGALGFYGKYCILAAHRSVLHAMAKAARLAQSGTCCVLGGHGATFVFLALHVFAGGVVSAVLCSRLGFNDRFVDPATGQIVDVYDRMARYLTPTPGSTLRGGVAAAARNGGGTGGGDTVAKLLVQHWYWTVFGLFNGAVAALLHVLGDRNVAAPVGGRPGDCASPNAVVAVATNFGRRLLGNARRSASAAAVGLALWMALSVFLHWGKRVAGDADAARWDEVGDLQLPLFDADGDGRFDGPQAVAGRLLGALLMLLRVAWGIHFVLDAAQLALDECVAYPVDLAMELGVAADGGDRLGGGDGGGDAVAGVRAAVAVLDHTASSQFEYLLKCYHGGIDGFTGDDHEVARRRSRSTPGRGGNNRNKSRRRDGGGGGGGGGRGGDGGDDRTSHSRQLSRRRRGVAARGGAVVALGPSVGPEGGDSSNTDSDSESSLGSDPDEDGEAQTPWRRELRQGALRFHSVALRSVYDNHNAMSQHPSYRLQVPTAVLARFDDARCFRHPRGALWESAFRNSSRGGGSAQGDGGAASSAFAGVVGQLARLHALEGLRLQLKYHAQAHAVIHEDALLHTRRHDSLALYHRSLWARIVASCTAHVDAFTLDALFASGSVLMPALGGGGDADGRGVRGVHGGGGGDDGEGSLGAGGVRTRGLRWNHVYMIDSDELGEAVGSCCPRGCGRFLGLRPLADLRRALQPYNSVAAYLLNYRAPQNFARDAAGVTASVLNDFQAVAASCDILVELLLRGYEWAQHLEALATITRGAGGGGGSDRGSAATDARNAAEIVEHALGRVLSCLLGALEALRVLAKAPVSLGAADQAAVLGHGNGDGGDDDGAGIDDCDGIMQRVRGQVYAMSAVLKRCVHRLARTHQGLQVSRRALPPAQALLLQQVLQAGV